MKIKGAFRITDKLNSWLHLKGWGAKELADELNCSISLVCHWTNKEKPRHPSWQMLRRLCLLTGLDVSQLLTFDRDIEQED